VFCISTSFPSSLSSLKRRFTFAKLYIQQIQLRVSQRYTADCHHECNRRIVWHPEVGEAGASRTDVLCECQSEGRRVKERSSNTGDIDGYKNHLDYTMNAR
jgi:hypothetical protein